MSNKLPFPVNIATTRTFARRKGLVAQQQTLQPGLGSRVERSLLQMLRRQINLGVGALQGSFLASDKPLLSVASRTSSLNPPDRGL
ncbi:hypothetical protein [Shinella sp. BE166]|uniref:hypothetical protein n=1 Tax=unclassified Shinella TaxID=2643062 RepID=UPI003EBAB046